MSRLGRIGHKLYTGQVSIDFTGRWRRWFVISGLIIAIAVGGVLIRGMNFSIEFRGGVDIQAPTTDPSSRINDVRAAVEELGIQNAEQPIVTAVGNNRIRVQTGTLDPADAVEVRETVAKTVGANSADVAYSSIGPSWGAQISQKAILSLVVFLVLVSLVIWAYFREPKMAVAGLVALFHDLIITIGIYALVGLTVTPATVIGLLTILGYSLYDTVVVFDKVRENTRSVASGSSTTYSEAANLAVNQTLVRSINTSVAALLPVGGILFIGTLLLGVGTLQDLALALFVGMAAGAYSSIFVATPLLALLKEREPAMKALTRRVANRRATAGVSAASSAARTGSVTGGATAVALAEDPGTAEPRRPIAAGPRQQPQRRPRSQRRGGPSGTARPNRS